MIEKSNNRSFNKRNDTNVKPDKHNINANIKAKELRLIGDNIENAGEIISTDKAYVLARKMGLDLVEISPNANPPVAKIIDYKKYLYNEDKRLKELEKKQKENNKPLKEVQFSPNIGVADIATKSKHIREFISENHKVKIVMTFKGREIATSVPRGEKIINDIIQSMSDISKVDAFPKLNGKNMITVLSPKK